MRSAIVLEELISVSYDISSLEHEINITKNTHLVSNDEVAIDIV